MTKSEFYKSLEEIIEAEPGTIKGDELLENLVGWDSMAVISFMAMADDRLGAMVSADRLQKCASVEDLVRLMDNAITE
jgi:acyl carrier protein